MSSSDSSPSDAGSSWPASYEVHTVGLRGRSMRPPRLNLSSDGSTRVIQQELTLTRGADALPNPFGTPPGTPGESMKGSVSSSSSSSSLNGLSSGIPPAPSTPPPVPPVIESEVFALSASSKRRPSTAPQGSTTGQAQMSSHAHTLSVPSADIRPGGPQRRARRERSFKGGSTLMTTSNVSLTPPTSPPATSDRSSFRDTFSPPPVLATSIRSSGTSTPSTRPGSSKHSTNGVTSWRLPSMLSDAGSDITYTLNSAEVANSLQAIKGGDSRYLSASYSTISFGEDSTGPFEKDTDVILRPCTLVQGEIHKPWMERKDWRVRASYWIFVFWVAVGMAGAALFTWHGYASVPLIKEPMCLVLSDDFDTFDTTNTWHREIDLGGFQNGEFEMTTDSPNNSYVQDGKLFIVPTLTSDVIGVRNVFDAYTFNATGCTNTVDPDNACGAVSNATSGTVINPIMSARLTTQKSFSIAYGKVEIRAKMPKGDWIWPSIWMLPVDNVYGDWPRSGEIDIVQSRGNGIRYKAGGQNSVHAALQWGPTVDLNRNWKTSGAWDPRRGSFANDFHTYTLEWTKDFLRVSVDSRLKHSLDLRFNTAFWERGTFPSEVKNGTGTIPLTNPWADRGNSAPFDQRFYLIMNLAVGGTHGYFPDNVGGKPWLDGSHTAMRDFALAQDQWYPTWPGNPEDRGLVIDYVKMWQLC